MHQQFKAISISHHTAPIDVRERVALEEQGCKNLLLQAREVLDIAEMLVLSTCNRTEIYYTSAEDRSEDIIKLIGIQKGLDANMYKQYFQSFTDHQVAVRRLFEVSLGIHSQVVGDLQITSQAKHAYQWAADVNMAGPFVHRLMHAIFFANKRVVQETAFRDGAASVSYATVELLEDLTTALIQPKVLVVGLGEIGTDVCKNLAENKHFEVTLCNRTHIKAEELATELNFKVLPFSQVEEKMRQYDVIISSVAKQDPFITQAMIKSWDILSYKFFVDLAVPRSIESTIEEIPGVVLYNIDEIQSRANEALQKRIIAIAHVQEIITEALKDFSDWSREMAVSPTINKLKNALEQIRQEELARHLKGLTPAETERIEQITKGIMQKIIKLPVLQLKAACKRGEAETLIDVLNDLFNLEAQSERELYK
ncbi:glutamyl-tRNA reductase [Xanthocytophaga agilis]|uniref:Glutamyl-tRNA reductase n=1 Tax=Xanthocytophaga agilis TaxID=3048010 RepID=A0AAE3UCY9_9BACT|nr:glutamyl-tRNA reductase [Xanthocytophaga agilis]MDJ1499801.1 glutamyl-tRNA reductase [Xanthocytophaga agilis]